MPSVKNPNGPSRNRLANRFTKQKAQRRKRSEHARHKIIKADTTRGARPGLLPTSGPNAPISKKKAKKLEQQLKLAERRRVEAEGLKDVEENEDQEGTEDQVEQNVDTKEVEMEDIR